jgi:hypothetical protein
MRVAPRLVTQVGIGSSSSDDTEVTAPDSRPPSSGRMGASMPPTRYSWVAPRRQTISMLAAPLTTDDSPTSRRRPTLRIADYQG